MPTYDFECTKCAVRFEFVQKMSDTPATKCPKCGGKATRLIGTGSGIIFKGTGFYETDYKRPASEKGQKEQKEKKSPPPCATGGACKGCPSGGGDR